MSRRGLPMHRRTFLRGVGAASVAPLLWRQPAIAQAPPPAGIHLQFGADPSSAMAVSWTTAAMVSRPRVRVGPATDRDGTVIDARTRTYVDALTGQETVAHHAALTGLAPATDHVYSVLHDGAAPRTGTFRTAPVGRRPFRFTSFGDQGTGQDDGPGGRSSVHGALVVDQIEALAPLFHLHNGDLAYADTYEDRPGAWQLFLTNNERSTRFRPWMPTMGNHEFEGGNGDLGNEAYLTLHQLPSNHTGDFEGMWYAFTVGSVRFISVNGDDVVYQEASDLYVRGYSDGRQRRWLERELASARSSPEIDWIVVSMHQLTVSSAVVFNGPDLGVREEFVPLFDRYGVDLVLNGHDHHYERSHPLRGVATDSEVLRPAVVSTELDDIDTEQGTVHVVAGGGGGLDLHETTASGRTGEPVTLVHTSRGGLQERVPERAVYSARRDQDFGYGFVAVDVDPGTEPGGTTTMTVRYFRTSADHATLDAPPVDQFTLRRRRADGRRPVADVPPEPRGVPSDSLPATGGGAAAVGLGAVLFATHRGVVESRDHEGRNAEQT